MQKRAPYQPLVDGNPRQKRGQRDSWARLRLIQSKADFAGKTVLDLGCSGGFFALSAAQRAKHILAVDADAGLIERNRREAERLGCDNIEFVHAVVDADFIATLPSFDIVLFLSVFHHIFVASKAYDWNKPAAEHGSLHLLERISKLADTYVFEMGEPWELHYAWADQIAGKVDDLGKWIPAYVFGPSYARIEALPGVAYQRWPFNRWPKLARPACRTRIGRTLLRQSRIQRRDFRTIYIGQRG